MARKQTKVHNGTLFSTLLVISLALLFLPHGITKNLNFFFIELFKPILSVGKEGPVYLFRPGDSSQKMISEDEYNNLWAAYKNIEADLLELHSEFEKLAQYRAVLPEAGIGIVPASIITFESSSFLMIDKGSEHGIEKGLFVIGGDAIVGRIKEVSPASSRVELVSQKNAITQIRIHRSGSNKYITANMVGTGVNTCKVGLIPRENDVKVGDTVYAAPKPGVLNSPRVIGEVVEAWPAENDPLLWDITVEPLYSAEDLKGVAVIIANPKKEN